MVPLFIIIWSEPLVKKSEKENFLCQILYLLYTNNHIVINQYFDYIFAFETNACKQMLHSQILIRKRNRICSFPIEINVIFGIFIKNAICFIIPTQLEQFGTNLRKVTAAK